jgi:nicotinamidase-related amidase
LGKTAFLIIDMQNDFCLAGAPFVVDAGMATIPFIKRALDACRKHRLPIVHVFRYYRADGSDVEITRYAEFKKAGSGLIRGSKGAEVVEELKPQPGEYLVIKQRWSAFFQTELDNLLKRLGVDQIVVTGVQTPNCIRGTVWDANSLDYEVIVLSDGTGANTAEVHQANLFDMKNIGVQVLTTEEFIKSLPNPPKEDLVAKIQAEMKEGVINPELATCLC